MLGLAKGGEIEGEGEEGREPGDGPKLGTVWCHTFTWTPPSTPTSPNPVLSTKITKIIMRVGHLC